MKKTTPTLVISMMPSKMGMSKHKGEGKECDDFDAPTKSKPVGKKHTRGGKRGC